MKNKVESKNTKKKETSINILEMWKQFWNSDPVELSQEEEIAKDDSTSTRNREALLKALRVADNIVQPTDGGVKAHLSNIKVNHKKAVEKSLQEKPVKINAKTAKVNPDNVSIMKYLGLIFCLQYLHFPPKNI